MDATQSVTNRGVVEVHPTEFGTVRVVWPDETITEIRRAPEVQDLVRFRIYTPREDIDRVLVQEHYGRPSGSGRVITGLKIERE